MVKRSVALKGYLTQNCRFFHYLLTPKVRRESQEIHSKAAFLRDLFSKKRLQMLFHTVCICAEGTDRPWGNRQPATTGTGHLTEMPH